MVKIKLSDLNCRQMAMGRNCKGFRVSFILTIADAYPGRMLIDL